MSNKYALQEQALSAGNALNDSSDFSIVGDSSKKNRRQWLILVSLSLLIAVVLRFIRIGHREFFGNEFLTLNLLSGGGPDIFLGRALDGATSIYHLFIQAWAGMFGSVSEAMLRVPSAIFGLSACVVFFLFSRKYLRGTALAICLLIFAMNPILVATSIDASPYALLTLWITLAHYFAIRSLDKGGPVNWSVYGASVLAGILTHPLFLFILPAHFLFALLRGRRTPKAFYIVSIFGVLALAGVAFASGIYADKVFPDRLLVQRPSSSDLARGLVSIALGNFPRYDAQSPNDFVRSVMYLFVFLCIVLSVQYYRKRTAEAMAMPENVVWIDETQDVVGTWERLSLRAFLLFQWFAFLLPLFGLLFLGSFVQGFRLTPDVLLLILPALAVLMAMGIDAAPKEGALALGLLLLLVMAYYDVRVLKDTGNGVKSAFAIVQTQQFNPKEDLLIYTEADSLAKSVAIYKGDVPSYPMPGFKTLKDFNARQKEMAELTAGYDRVFVIYHEDRKNLGKTEERSPLREWLNKPADNRFTEVEDWKKLSEAEGTELRLYKRLAPGEQPEG